MYILHFLADACCALADLNRSFEGLVEFRLRVSASKSSARSPEPGDEERRHMNRHEPHIPKPKPDTPKPRSHPEPSGPGSALDEASACSHAVQNHGIAGQPLPYRLSAAHSSETSAVRVISRKYRM